MRKLAAQGAKPCPNDIPSDLLAANCIPPGFMVQTGWDIVCDYYQVQNSYADLRTCRSERQPSTFCNNVRSSGRLC